MILTHMQAATLSPSNVRASKINLDSTSTFRSSYQNQNLTVTRPDCNQQQLDHQSQSHDYSHLAVISLIQYIMESE